MKLNETYKNNTKDEKDKSLKMTNEVSTPEALNTISKELIPTHKSTAAVYWRCGWSNNRTIECNAKTTKKGDSLEMLTISSQNNQNGNDDDDGGNNLKKAKMAAIWAEPENQ
jgi:hypothetical protein